MPHVNSQAGVNKGNPFNRRAGHFLRWKEMAFEALEVLVNCGSNWETFTFSVCDGLQGYGNNWGGEIRCYFCLGKCVGPGDIIYTGAGQLLCITVLIYQVIVFR